MATLHPVPVVPGRAASPAPTLGLRQSPPSHRVDPDVICFSQRPWGARWERSTQIMARFARERRVFFFEEPAEGAIGFELDTREGGVQVVRPRVPRGLAPERRNAVLAGMVHELIAHWRIGPFVLWYDTPLALAYTRRLRPLACVYDCVREHAGFCEKAETWELERELLLERAHVVFAADRRIYEIAYGLHPSVHWRPSGIDREPFAKARAPRPSRSDGALTSPIVGYAGDVDETTDLGLLAALARRRRDWTFAMSGERSDIAPGDLPREANLHWLGPPSHERLADDLRGWDAALVPLRPDAGGSDGCRIAEYLAAGLPVVATKVPDVEERYGALVPTASSVADVAAALESALAEGASEPWLRRVDVLLDATSWDRTWSRMVTVVDHVSRAREPVRWSDTQIWDA